MEDKVEVKNPENPSEIEDIYNLAIKIGEFLLYDRKNRLSKFKEWILDCKNKNFPIRYVYNDRISDVEIFVSNKSWKRIGNLTCRALKEEYAPKKR